MIHRCDVLVCLYRNLLLVFGGTGLPFGFHVSNDLFVLDLKRLHWKRYRTRDEQPQQVYGAVKKKQLSSCSNFSLTTYFAEYGFERGSFIYLMRHKQLDL